MSVNTFKDKYNKYYFRDVIRLWVHSQLGLKDDNYYNLHWFFEYSIEEDTETLSEILNEIERPERIIDRAKRVFIKTWKSIKSFLIRCLKKLKPRSNEWDD